MAATGVLGAKLYVGPTALADIEGAADAIGDFTALSSPTEIGLIESIGEFGKVFDLVPFQGVATGRMYKFKGGYNQGQLTVTVAADLTDAGQAVMKTYADAQDQNTYPFKLTINGADASFDTVYFGGKVMSFRFVMGAVNTIVKATIQIEINTDVFIGAD